MRALILPLNNSEECGLAPGLGSGQFKYRNLRAGADPDRKASGADAAIDVELAAALFVRSVDVMCHQAAEVEAAMNEIERQLSAVSVAAQDQVQIESHGLAEGVRVVHHDEAAVLFAGVPQGAAPGASGQGPAAGPDGAAGEEKPKDKDNVVDAEFVDVDEKK